MLSLVAIALGAILVRVHVEETELAAALGTSYTSYTDRTRVDGR